MDHLMSKRIKRISKAMDSALIKACDMVPSAEKVFKLAEVYGCTPNYLLGWE